MLTSVATRQTQPSTCTIAIRMLLAVISKVHLTANVIMGTKETGQFAQVAISIMQLQFKHCCVHSKLFNMIAFQTLLYSKNPDIRS